MENDTILSQYDDAQYLREMFEGFLTGLNFCLPCVVEKVNAEKQTVDIRPQLKSYFVSKKQNISRPIITDVPFQVFRAGDTYISLPIKVGDTGIAVFSQRDISNWKKIGGEVPLQSYRMCDYNDAFFLPYVGSENKAIENYNENFIEIVKNGKKITVKDGVLDAPEYIINCKQLNALESITAGTTITALVDVLATTISLLSHIHGGVASGNRTTGTPQ